jgi:hypothetical protein
MLKRTTATDIKLEPRVYTPETSKSVKEKLVGTVDQVPGKRVRRPKIDLKETNKQLNQL